MSRHVTYRGTTIDMESLGRENEYTTAIGNMKVNARGDQIDRGVITKTADELARENHRVQSVVVSTGLKGRQPQPPAEIQLDLPKQVKPKSSKEKQVVKEIELPNGDIVVGDNNAS